MHYCCIFTLSVTNAVSVMDMCSNVALDFSMFQFFLYSYWWRWWLLALTGCKAGYFGWGCRFRCDCLHDGNCDSTTGHCETGCPDSRWGIGCLLGNCLSCVTKLLKSWRGYSYVFWLLSLSVVHCHFITCLHYFPFIVVGWYQIVSGWTKWEQHWRRWKGI